MKSRIFLLGLSLLFTAVLSAQDAQNILDALSVKTNSYTSIDANFSIRLIDKQSGIDEKQEGSIKLKGEKYQLDIDEYIIVTDGENFWTYEKDQNSCTIDYVEDMEEDGMDIKKLFTIWEDDFKNEHKGDVVVDGKSLTQINLYPIDPKEKDFHTVQLFIDEAKMELRKVIIKGKDGSEQIYTLTNFKTDTAMPESLFLFDKNNYPGVEMIDNRI